MTDKLKALIVELYESASGHLGGEMLLGAIAVAVEERTGTKVTLRDVAEVICEHEKDGEK